MTMGASGSKGKTSTSYQAADPEAARRLAGVAEREAAMGEEQQGIAKEVYLPYEKAMVEANMGLVQPQADLSREEIASGMRLMPAREAATQASLEESRRDIEMGRPLKDETRNQALAELRASSPAMEKFYQEAADGVDPNYARVEGAAGADVAQGYKAAEGMMRRAAGRMGQGGESANLASTGLSFARDMAGAKTMAREGERQRAETQGFQRLTTAMGMRGRTGLAGLGDMGSAGTVATPYVAGDMNQGDYRLTNPNATALAAYGGAATANMGGMKTMGSSGHSSQTGWNASVSAKDIMAMMEM